jgi:hypothetical protein
MKTFSELLDTKLELTVVVNGVSHRAALHEVLVFDENSTVTVDGIEVLPKYRYLANNGALTVAKPFYQWYHDVSGQGWLLNPNK